MSCANGFVSAAIVVVVDDNDDYETSSFLLDGQYLSVSTESMQKRVGVPRQCFRYHTARGR